MLVLVAGLCDASLAQDSSSILPDTTVASRDSLLRENLEEVTVTGSRLTIADDHITAIPTPQQQRHAHGGYDLLNNLMIPGLTVDKKNKKVSAPVGEASIYINGRKASVREVQTLRSRDVTKVEYYDVVNGRFAGDVASVNIVTQSPQAGGYTQLEAKQGAGFPSGEYSVSTRYSTNGYNLNAWIGYERQQPKTVAEKGENYFMTNRIADRQMEHGREGADEKEGYGIISLSHFAKRTTWMIRSGVERHVTDDDISQGSLRYNDSAVMPAKWTTLFSQDIRRTTTKPLLYVYFKHLFDSKKSLDMVLDAYHSNNKYVRSYIESANAWASDVKENLNNVHLNAVYTTQLRDKSNLTFTLHDFLRTTKSDYFVEPASSQDLFSNEAIFFADYAKKISNHTMIDFCPGVSMLVYKLHGFDHITRFAPRLRATVAYNPTRIHRMQFRLNVGNTSPRISTMNGARQTIDRYMVRSGNPDLDNSTLIQPFASYTFMKKKVQIGFSVQHLFIDHALTEDYLSNDDFVENTYGSRSRYNGTSVDLSFTYKPTDHLNMKLDVGYHNTRISGLVAVKQDTWLANLLANYYLGEFSLSLACHTPRHEVIANQYIADIPWQVDFSAQWNHGNFSTEISVANPFLRNNEYVEWMHSEAYSTHSILRKDIYNQYLCARITYTIDYGKKVSKSPKYTSTGSESAIIL